MPSPTALPLVQYHARLVAPAWGPHPEPLELEGPSLSVRGMELREEIGLPWRMTLEVMSRHPDFDPSRLAGAELSLHMLREDDGTPAENDGRFFHGVVQIAEYVGAFAEAYHARLVVEPALALLRETRRSRIFQDVTVVEVAQQVTEALLGERGGSLDVGRLTREYPARDYCVQYEESDLAFMLRVLAEEGITLGFEADESREVAVLFDDHEQFGSMLRVVEGLESSPPPQHVHVRGDRGELADEETIASFTWLHRLVPSSAELEQWDWKQAAPGQLHARAAVEQPSARHVGAVYQHGGRRLQEASGGDGPHLDDSTDRLERDYARLALDASGFEGTSNVMSMRAGATFELDGHPDNELGGIYYCMQVTHAADNADVELGAAGGSSYDNRFVCASIEQAFSPEVPPRPRIYGVQTATVVGPAGDEIHTDAYGRIQVRMHWDREQRERDDTSCWLRVAHGWAGAGFGSQFIPRVGMEVLVSFLGGDADRPVCVGAVYGGSHMPPYPLPDNKTQSGIKTQSTPGGGGFNELRFEDASGKEEIYMHAQRDHTERVLHAHAQRIGATQTVDVGSDQTTCVGGRRVVNITGDQQVTVGAPPPPDGSPAALPSNHGLTVEGDVVVTSNQKSITLTAPQSISLICGGSSIVLTPSAITLVSGGGTQLGLTAGMAMATAGAGVTMDMSDTGTMNLASIAGSSVTMDGDVNLTSAAQSALSLSDTVLARSCAGASAQLAADATLQGSSVTARSAGSSLELGAGIDASGGTHVELGAAASKLALTPAAAKLSGAVVDVAGMGMVNIGAPNVKIN